MPHAVKPEPLQPATYDDIVTLPLDGVIDRDRAEVGAGPCEDHRPSCGCRSA